MKKIFFAMALCMAVTCHSQTINNGKDSISQKKIDSITTKVNKIISDTTWHSSKQDLAKYKIRFYIIAKDFDELMEYMNERKSEGFLLKEMYEKDGEYYILFVK